MNEAHTQPMLDSRSKTPTLAQAAANSKALKTPVPVAKATVAKPAAKAKPAVDQKAKAAADKAKAVEKAKADKEKAKAKLAREEARTEAKENKAKEKRVAAKSREEARAKAKAERIAAGGADRLVPANLSTYRYDKENKTAGGHVSVDSGDAMATKLRGKSLDEVYAMAAATLKEPEKDLRTKYAALNVGMQRMNLGNRMRAAVTGPKVAKEAPKAKAPATAKAKK